MSATDRSHGSRHIVGRHIGKLVGALAVALTGAALTASGASAATQCVEQTFGPSNTYQACVRDEQVLLNNLWQVHAPGPNQLLATDGYYGPHTASDVASFTHRNFLSPLWNPATTIPETWAVLCHTDEDDLFQGVFWHGAGCWLDPA